MAQGNGGGRTDRQAAVPSRSPGGDTQWAEMLEVAKHRFPASSSPRQRRELPNRHCHLVAQRPARLGTVRHRTSYIARRASHIVHRTSYISHHASHVIHCTSHIVHRTSHVIHHTSRVVHRTPRNPGQVNALQRCTQTLLAGELPPGESVPKR